MGDVDVAVAARRLLRASQLSRTVLHWTALLAVLALTYLHAPGLALGPPSTRARGGPCQERAAIR